MKLTELTPEARAKWLASLITDTVTTAAIRKGERAGRFCVSALATDHGASELTYRAEPWDADARRTLQHRTEGVSDEFAEPFYEAFNRAASDMAAGYRLAFEHSLEANAEWDHAEDR